MRAPGTIMRMKRTIADYRFAACITAVSAFVSSMAFDLTKELYFWGGWGRLAVAYMATTAAALIFAMLFGKRMTGRA
jgi:hypothetical protein